MSQLSESGGVQTNVTINGLPSSPGGSAHQPQLSEAQTSAEKFLTGDQRLNYYRLNYYQPLFNAAQRGNWKSAKSFIDRDPNALTARITAVSSRTVFHVAALSCQWGLVLKLLELIVSPESLASLCSSSSTTTCKLLLQRISGKKNQLKTAILSMGAGPWYPSDSDNEGLDAQPSHKRKKKMFARHKKARRNRHKTKGDLQIEDANQPEGSVLKDKQEVDLKRLLYTAALEGNWETADRVIKQNDELLTAEISMLSMTALHIAAFSGHSKFVEKLIEQMTPEEVAVKDFSGNTALNHAATTGNLNVAIALLRTNSGLTDVQGNQGFLPLLTAVVYGADKGKDMAWFLAMRTKNPFVKTETTSDCRLLLELTHAGFHDITLHLLGRFPELATYREDKSGRNILSILAVRPTDFQSGTKLNFWETWIYKLAPSKQLSSVRGDVEDPPEDTDNSISRTRLAKVCKWFREQTWKVVMALAPSTSKRLQDAKLRHKYALELVTFVCDRAKHMSNGKFVKFFVNSEILNIATSSGIVEIVKICLQHFPDLIWLRKSWKTVLHVAIEHRRELIFNLIYKRSALCKLFDRVGDKKELIGESSQGKGLETENYILTEQQLSETTTIAANLASSSQSSSSPGKARQLQEVSETTMMHLAANLAPSSQLLSAPGKALQMQRELQWFKEVGKLAHPSDKENKDDNGYTPRELFTEQHKDLVKEAEKWMKDTSTSCMVVTTLIATVVFASAFTIPGGNNSNGFPIFFAKTPFMVFMISDALSLFSALTSVLMFLSILTARYAEEDFLKKLPLKLLLGLAFLFFAIATMMIAFVAAIWIVFHDRFKWVSIRSPYWLLSP
ncbi:hypothetical protein ACOSQ4_020430 [Xanthoceras sorbifolium]